MTNVISKISFNDFKLKVDKNIEIYIIYDIIRVFNIKHLLFNQYETFYTPLEWIYNIRNEMNWKYNGETHIILDGSTFTFLLNIELDKLVYLTNRYLNLKAFT